MAEEKSYLVKGNISGIQEFIFNVTSKGAAKTLKAKSFRIEMLGWMAEEVVKTYFQNAISIFNGGGNFYLEVDHINWDIEKFNKAKNQLMGAFPYNNLMICLGFVACDDSKSFGEWISEVNKMTGRVKLAGHRGNENDGEQLFEPFNFIEKPNQEDYKSFTSELARSKSWNLVADTSNEKSVNSFLDFSIKLSQDKPTDPKTKIYPHIPVWGDELKLSACKDLFDEKAVEDSSYERPRLGEIVGFEHFAYFAKRRTGLNKIGILKLDVDNLSSVFSKLKNKSENQFLSKQLTIFFNERLEQLLDSEYSYLSQIKVDGVPKEREDTFIDKSGKIAKFNVFETQMKTEKFRENLYVVFSGGDDSFIIGAWDAIIEFSLAFQKAFAQFEKNEIRDRLDYLIGPITISCGIVLVDPQHPVVKFADIVETELHKAKTQFLGSEQNDASGKPMKDRIAFMGYVFNWADFHNIIEIKDQFMKIILKYGESKAVLQRIIQGFDDTENQYWAIRSKPFNPAILWRFLYHFRDIRNKLYFRLRFDEYFFSKPNLSHPKGIYYSYLWDVFDSSRVATQQLPVAARWTEFLTRNITQNMKHSSYQEKKSFRGRNGSGHKKEMARAEDYLKEVALLLNIDNASAKEIKTGVSKIEELVKNNSNVKAHQVRNIFNLVKESHGLEKLNQLRPKLAYIGARQTTDDGKRIAKLIDLLIVRITDHEPEEERPQLLKGLKYIVESIVAYHKFYSNEKY